MWHHGWRIFAEVAGKQLRIDVPIAPTVPLVQRPSVLSKPRKLDVQQREIPKLALNMQNPSAGTRRRALPGMHPCNQVGSRAKCFRKKSNRCLPTFQRPPFDHELASRAGTQAAFGRATVHIPGIGSYSRS
ncbi:MAG: hypothetical protein DMG98_28605 [Acidobacteria bacterium]|nr:MAG: hypothetical protein DMG98_28605 [Acidobacteriota bacterium]